MAPGHPPLKGWASIGLSLRDATSTPPAESLGAHSEAMPPPTRFPSSPGSWPVGFKACRRGGGTEKVILGPEAEVGIGGAGLAGVGREEEPPGGIRHGGVRLGDGSRAESVAVAPPGGHRAVGLLVLMRPAIKLPRLESTGQTWRIREGETGPLPKAGARVSSPAARRDGHGRWTARSPRGVLHAAGEDTRAPGPFVNPPCRADAAGRRVLTGPQVFPNLSSVLSKLGIQSADGIDQGLSCVLAPRWLVSTVFSESNPMPHEPPPAFQPARF